MPGRILLADLTAQQVQALFTAIARQHQAEGHPVTAATLARVRATLRAALHAAIRARLISANAASRAELPAARRPRPVVDGGARRRLAQSINLAGHRIRRKILKDSPALLRKTQVTTRIIFPGPTGSSRPTPSPAGSHPWPRKAARIPGVSGTA